MKYPKLQILTDYKSFRSLYEIDARGEWRDLELNALRIICQIMSNDIEHEIIIYNESTITKPSHKEDILLRSSSLFFVNKPLEYFDSFSINSIGRLIEINNLDYKTNYNKSIRLKRICFNLNDSLQIFEILGFLGSNYCGYNCSDINSIYEEDFRSVWNNSSFLVADTLIMANSFVPSWKKSWNGYGPSQLELEFKRLFGNYLKVLFPLDTFSGKCNFYYLTKIRSKFNKKNDPLNIVDKLLNDFNYTDDDIQELMRQSWEGFYGNVKLIISDNWHHRKIFSDYFRIVHDDTLGLGRSTTFSIEGILHSYSGYWEGLGELRNHGNGKFDIFFGEKSLKEVLANRS